MLDKQHKAGREKSEEAQKARNPTLFLIGFAASTVYTLKDTSQKLLFSIPSRPEWDTANSPRPSWLHSHFILSLLCILSLTILSDYFFDISVDKFFNIVPWQVGCGELVVWIVGTTWNFSDGILCKTELATGNSNMSLTCKGNIVFRTWLSLFWDFVSAWCSVIFLKVNSCWLQLLINSCWLLSASLFTEYLYCSFP